MRRLASVIVAAAVALGMTACGEDEGVGCRGVVCASGVCDRGICVTKEMRAAQLGDACNPRTFNNFCRGNLVVGCSVNNTVIALDCVDAGGCAVLHLETDDMLERVPWCRGPSSQCRQEGDIVGYYCAVDGGVAYESAHICIPNTDGSFSAFDLELLDMWDYCPLGCNAQWTACR